MKKIFSTIVILIALLTMTTGAAFAGSVLELVGVRNGGGGPTFVFRVTGEFSRSELESGFVTVDGETFPLYCVQQDADTVVCHTSKVVSGHEVVVGFGGARFWDKVPEQSSGKSGNYCYSAWDFWDFTNNQWTDFGPICQDEPAQYGDVSYYDYPAEGIYGSYVEFYDFDVSDNCGPDSVPYYGPAYYYPSCPSN